jgi:hypothetical protein
MPAKKRRRYTRYNQDDTYRALHAHQDMLHIEIVPDSVHGNRITIKSKRYGELHAVVLARSSQWYHYSLNAVTWKHGLQAAIVGTHDSCLPVRVLAMDSMQWYEPYGYGFTLPPQIIPGRTLLNNAVNQSTAITSCLGLSFVDDKTQLIAS